MAIYTVGQIGPNICGAYDSAATYNPQDVVFHNGSSYIAVNNGVRDSEPSPDSADWQLLAQGSDDAAVPELLERLYGSISNPSYGNGELRWRKIGNHIYISGSITAKYTGSGKVLASLGTAAAPLYGNVYSLRPCSGGRIARLFVSTTGDLTLEWIKNISDASNYTSAAIWIDCNFDYWID